MPEAERLVLFLVRYGLDALFLLLVLKGLGGGEKRRKAPKRRKSRKRRKGWRPSDLWQRFDAAAPRRKLLIGLGVSLFLVQLVVPTVFGPFSATARYFPQFIEGHKLRFCYRPIALLPGVGGSRSDIEREIVSVAEEYGMSSALIRAVVETESGFNQFAISETGACGLMQLMPDTYYSLRWENPYMVRPNLRAGTEYLRSLYRSYNGDLQLALAAYNAGPGTVRSYGGIPPGAPTRYVEVVLSRYAANKAR